MSETEGFAAQVADQLADGLFTAAAALNTVLSLGAALPGGLESLAQVARDDAERLTAQLLSGDDDLAAQTVTDLAGALGWHDPDSAWWQTPLGQAVARSVGHPSAEAISYSTAGAMLGVSKQMIGKHVNAGRLDRSPDGGVTSTSVMQFARHQAR